MDFGLTPQQRIILRRARAKRLPGSQRSQIVPPMWGIALAALLPLLLVGHPSRYLSLLLLPPLGWWQRSRVEERIREWALDLREI